MTAILDLRAVSARIGTATLLSEASLSLRPGTLTVVIGPNGAGKSTLLRIASGELVPSAGEVLACGRPIGAIPGWELACFRAVLPQASRLAFPFGVAEVARIGLAGIGRGLSAAQREEMLREALAGADLLHLAARSYQSLSGGEQQRTHFARVLAQLAAGRSVARRQCLLLDEPTASLDLAHQVALLDRTRRLAREGLAVLAILHDLNLAAAYADRLVAVSRGRIVADGTPREVLTDDLLAEVFGLRLRVNDIPRDRPFVLPIAQAFD